MAALLGVDDYELAWESFNLSGEIPQVAALPCPGRKRDSFYCFNLSGEIPQVAAPQSSPPSVLLFLFQSLRRDSSSGR